MFCRAAFNRIFFPYVVHDLLGIATSQDIRFSVCGSSITVFAVLVGHFFQPLVIKHRNSKAS